MRWRPFRPLMWGIAAVLIAASALTGCSTNGPKISPPSRSTTAAAAAGPGVVSRSPAGVTTKIDVPPRSTEEAYFRACHAASVSMHAHLGDAQTQAERSLAGVHPPGVGGRATCTSARAAL